MPTLKKTAGGLLAMSVLVIGTLQAAERPTLVHTADPRPDILPRPFYEAYDGYRRRYNRPRNIPGMITRWMSPPSQEGMVWYENKLAGSYDRHHLPPRYKRYFVPKPWEALPTGARPDFPEDTEGAPGTSPAGEEEASRNLDEVYQVPEQPEAATPLQ
jgi:hypothetical protein